MITQKQIELIEWMNEFCTEKFDLKNNKSKEEASQYISRNIEEYKLLTTSAWALEHGYFQKGGEE